MWVIIQLLVSNPYHMNQIPIYCTAIIKLVSVYHFTVFFHDFAWLTSRKCLSTPLKDTQDLELRFKAVLLVIVFSAIQFFDSHYFPPSAGMRWGGYGFRCCGHPHFQTCPYLSRISYEHWWCVCRTSGPVPRLSISCISTRRASCTPYFRSLQLPGSPWLPQYLRWRHYRLGQGQSYLVVPIRVYRGSKSLLIVTLYLIKMSRSWVGSRFSSGY